MGTLGSGTNRPAFPGNPYSFKSGNAQNGNFSKYFEGLGDAIYTPSDFYCPANRNSKSNDRKQGQVEDITGKQEDNSLERNNPCLWPEAGGFCASLLAGAGRRRFAAGSRRRAPKPGSATQKRQASAAGALGSPRASPAPTPQPRDPRPAPRAGLPRRVPSR